MFRLPGENSYSIDPVIPMLVTNGKHLSHPIIGYNAIEFIVTGKSTDPACAEQLKRIVNMALPRLEINHIQAFIELVKAEIHMSYGENFQRKGINSQAYLFAGWVPNKDKPTEGGHYFDVWTRSWSQMGEKARVSGDSCKGKDAPLYIVFGAQNPTDNDIVLCGKTVIGTTHGVQAVYPSISLDQPIQSIPPSVNPIQRSNAEFASDAWDPPVNLGLLCAGSGT